MIRNERFILESYHHDMSNITLSDGTKALIDDKFVPIFSPLHWRRTGSRREYATTTIEHKSVLMHRWIMEIELDKQLRKDVLIDPARVSG